MIGTKLEEVLSAKADFKIRREPFGGILFYRPRNRLIFLNETSFVIASKVFGPCDMSFGVEAVSEELNLTHTIAEEYLSDFLSQLEQVIKPGFEHDYEYFIIPEIASRPPSLRYLSSPVYFSWEVNDKCNYRCIYCSAEATYLKDSISYSTLTKEEAMDVARRAVNAGIMSVFFTGGEPLLAEYLFEVVSYLLRNGINVDIATNGALIESRIENLLAVDESLRPYLNLQVKLDTVDGENYAKLMGFPDPGLDSVLRGIDLLDENGFGFTIKSAITPETVRDVPKIADTMLSKANLMAINFDTVFPIGRGNNLMGSPWMAWTTDRKKEMLTVISEQVRKAPDKVVYDNVLDEWVPLNKSELGNPVYDCKAARMFLRLKSNGQLAPCNSTRDTEVGLLGSQSIQEAWENSEGLKKIRKNGIWCPLRRGIPKDLEEIKEFAVKLKLLTLTKK